MSEPNGRPHAHDGKACNAKACEPAPGVVVNPEVVKQLLLLQASSLEKVARIACGFQHSSGGQARVRRWEDCVWQECQYARAGVENLRRLAADEGNTREDRALGLLREVMETVGQCIPGNVCDVGSLYERVRRLVPLADQHALVTRPPLNAEGLLVVLRERLEHHRLTVDTTRRHVRDNPVGASAEGLAKLRGMGETCEAEVRWLEKLLAEQDMTCGGCGERGHVTGGCPDRKRA